MISEQQLAQLRQDTPACQQLIHFNNAGAALMPDPVFTSVLEHLRLENTRGGYEAARIQSTLLDDFYKAFADLLNAQANEIAYCENATRAWDMAFYALPLNKGDRILTHESEYASNYLAYLQLSRRLGIEIDLVPSDEHGQIDLDALESFITSQSRVIAITHVPTQGGLINPVEQVGDIAKKHGLFYVVDACQSTGQLPIDVNQIQCDILTGTGRKYLRGPRGTGFLYVRRDITDQLDPPFIDLHSATWTGNEFEYQSGARRFENWESNVAGKIGLATAVRYALDIGLDNIAQRNRELSTTLRTQLSSIPGVIVHDLGAHKAAICTFTKKGVSNEEISAQLTQHNINVSLSYQESAYLDLNKRGLSSLVRASLHYYNTHTEIDKFCGVINDL